ncbi:Hypothetical protein Bbr_0590 [Bifidobacterium breve UCC2003]|nr:Hypothetical protein Bbr_0590 [Bifidobacterium breve UCC2003]
MTGQRDADGRDQTNHAATIRYIARKNVRPTMPILPVQEQGTRHQQYTGHQAGHPPTTRRGLCQRRRQTIRRPVHEIPRLQQASRHIPVPQPPTTNLLAHKRTSRKHRQGGEHHERHGQTRPQTANRVNDERRQRYRRKHNDEHPNIGDGRQRPPITRPIRLCRIHEHYLHHHGHHKNRQEPQRLQHHATHSERTMPRTRTMQMRNRQRQQAMTLILQSRTTIRRGTTPDILLDSLQHIPDHGIILIGGEKTPTKILILLILRKLLPPRVSLPPTLSSIRFPAHRQSSILYRSLIPTRMALDASAAPSDNFPGA